MQNFAVYFELGLTHILDPAGADHMVYLLALCAFYTFADWKALLATVSTFTLGHTITLALSHIGFAKDLETYIEFFIPITIIVTAFLNLLQKSPKQAGPWRLVLAGVFGLIHGLGFGNFYRMLSAGNENWLLDLLPFTLGIELGQLILVLGITLLGWALPFAFSTKPRDYTLVLSGAAIGAALLMLMAP